MGTTDTARTDGHQAAAQTAARRQLQRVHPNRRVVSKPAVDTRPRCKPPQPPLPARRKHSAHGGVQPKEGTA